MGPNGSGKSTTQKILTGILNSYGEKVRLFDQEPCQKKIILLEKMGVLFEYPYLYTNLRVKKADNVLPITKHIAKKNPSNPMTSDSFRA